MSRSGLAGRIRADMEAIRRETSGLEVRLAKLKSNLEELEIANRVLFRYETEERTVPPNQEIATNTESSGEWVARSAPRPVPPEIRGDLFGRSIREAARIILSEIEQAEYAEVARRALGRGYRSHKSGDDLEKITRSFYETMRRHPDDFLQSGAVFSLKTGPRDAVAPVADTLPAEEAIPEEVALPVSANDPTGHEDPEVFSVNHYDEPASPSAISSIRLDPGPVPVVIPDSVPVSDCSASIEWGDGTRSDVAVVTRLPDGFRVGGSHIYARPGNYPLTVTLRTAGVLEAWDSRSGKP